jgi:hypothetical protein
MVIKVDENKQMFEELFARSFDETNSNWSDRLEYNEMFLKVQESYFNDKLAARGHLFLNEVYDALGFERVPQGQLIGWIHSDGERVIFRLTKTDNAIFIEFNITNSDTMYHKI